MGLPARRARCALLERITRRVLERLIIPLLRGEQQLGQRLALHNTKEENDQHDRRDNAESVHDAAQTLPSLTLWVVENLLHRAVVFKPRLRHKVIALSLALRQYF